MMKRIGNAVVCAQEHNEAFQYYQQILTCLEECYLGHTKSSEGGKVHANQRSSEIFYFLFSYANR